MGYTKYTQCSFNHLKRLYVVGQSHPEICRSSIFTEYLPQDAMYQVHVVRIELFHLQMLFESNMFIQKASGHYVKVPTAEVLHKELNTVYSHCSNLKPPCLFQHDLILHAAVHLWLQLLSLLLGTRTQLHYHYLGMHYSLSFPWHVAVSTLGSQ